jgi:uncharacterized protein (TIGR03435 family)
MKSLILGAAILASVWFPGLAQGPSGAPSFDVASVKVSELNGMGGEGSRKANLRAEPGSLSIRNLTFKSCVSWAYHLKDYQVTGPGWIDSERYDIVAKAAVPAKDDDLRKMLQTLLAERFKLACHRETRELPVYILTVAKDGLKMKPSEGPGESSFQPVKGPNRLALSVSHTSVAQFADLLGSGPLQAQPVLDETGLDGTYDFTIDVGRYLDLAAMQGPGDGGPRREGGGSPVGAPAIENAIVMALREQLGLKVESKKHPIDMMVVDRAEKAPTEN